MGLVPQSIALFQELYYLRAYLFKLRLRFFHLNTINVFAGLVFRQHFNVLVIPMEFEKLD